MTRKGAVPVYVYTCISNIPKAPKKIEGATGSEMPGADRQC